MRMIADKGEGRSNFGDFCAYVLCGWPPEEKLYFSNTLVADA